MNVIVNYLYLHMLYDWLVTRPGWTPSFHAICWDRLQLTHDPNHDTPKMARQHGLFWIQLLHLDIIVRVWLMKCPISR